MLNVVYRLCGIASTNPSPIYQEDKDKLNELCLKSFAATFRDVKPYMYFIMDFCPPEYVDMLNRVVPFKFDYEQGELGINGTALRSYEVAEMLDGDITLFQECDYVYRGSVGEQMAEAIKHFKLFSPYDHPDFYSRYDIHSPETELQIFNSEHFRKSRRNTMTFGMTKEALKANKKILDKYGYLDAEVWQEMRENGYPLWTPIPAYATHMAKDFLSPGVPWEILWKIYT